MFIKSVNWKRGTAWRKVWRLSSIGPLRCQHLSASPYTTFRPAPGDPNPVPYTSRLSFVMLAWLLEDGRVLHGMDSNEPSGLPRCYSLHLDAWTCETLGQPAEEIKLEAQRRSQFLFACWNSNISLASRLALFWTGLCGTKRARPAKAATHVNKQLAC